MDSGELVLVDPWWDLRTAGTREEHERRRIAHQIVAETSPGHDLFGKHTEVIGRSTARDDVLVRAVDGRWAIVHLTYSGRQVPPWPTTTWFDSVEALGLHLASGD